jgi:hypothetical protein
MVSQKKYNRFQQSFCGTGGGCFTCSDCGKKTRDTGENGSVGLCPECYDDCIGENMIVDGYAIRDEKTYAPGDQSEITTKEIDGKIYNFYDEVMSAVQSCDIAENLKIKSHKDVKIIQRFVDDTIKGKCWMVYDIYVRDGEI